ncbi:Thiamine transporter 1-like [Homarus americanus]|uniref:Thiamine transporter 1-like n=1 Tax=Homarus americanus TaxID=6706 RepID=A0A8J5T3N1_HOMAM|nr:Thiamine transporter 1-like [Homarus americanus]
MDTWLQTCLLLCLYGFFKEMRPSEPFLTEYLMGPQQNLTSDQVTYDVYPVWTYSYLALLIVVFLLTDLLRYKPVIVFEGIGYVITWSLLLWARGVRAMQFMEFTYGIATSTEVAYFTYIYAKVASKFYQRVTSYTRAALLAGRFMSGILAQVLTSTRLMDYHTLNYISLTSVSVAFIIACCLPAVSTSIYFHRQQYLTTNEGESSVRLTDINSKESLHAKITKVAGFVWNDFKSAYTNKYLLKWSIWWAFATCGNYQVGNYIQPLWESIAPMDQNDQLYNGAVEAIQTLLSSLAAFSVGYIHFNWELYQVAKQLTADSYGLVFGINMFASLLLQSVLTFVVVETLEVESSTQASSNEFLYVFLSPVSGSLITFLENQNFRTESGEMVKTVRPMADIQEKEEVKVAVNRMKRGKL